ncbi:MAG: GNAT family N-acetyltransferase [Pseudomonadota bacterium]
MPTTREYHSLTDIGHALHGGVDGGAASSLFERFAWFDLLHRHCLPDQPVRIVMAQENGAQVWLFLTSPAARRVSALANWYSFDWAPVFVGAHDRVQRDRLLDAATRHLLGSTRQVDLYPMEQCADLIASLRRSGWFAVSRPMGGRYLLRRGERDFAEYWAARPGPLRTLVRRKSRNSPYILSITDTLTDDLWQDYCDVQGRSWKQPEPGLLFLRALAQQESDAGRLRLGFARMDGHAVATQFWTVDRGVALIHKLSHDRAHDAGSPGTLLSHAMFAHALDADRVDMIDYGTGDNPYKTDWMEERVPLHRIDAFNPRFASSWLPAARTAISALVG